ncbi:hypothetical protein B1149_05950 [Enterococcus faecium]|nr:hypothetical protein B1149_05950 [Enterococcus faecium]
MLTKFLKKIMFHIKMERLKKRKRLLMRINNDYFSCLLIHVDERVFPKTLYKVIIVHLLSLLQ